MSDNAKQKRSGRRAGRDLALALQVIILVAAVIFALFPVVWVLSAALNPSQSMSSQSVIPPLPDTRIVTADSSWHAAAHCFARRRPRRAQR